MVLTDNNDSNSSDPESLFQLSENENVENENTKKKPSVPADTVIIVTKKNGETEEMLLRSLLKSQGNSNGKIEKIKIIKCPITDIKDAHVSHRANLRQQLMKQQLQDEENRGRTVCSRPPPTNVIDMPVVSPLETCELPTKILQVETRLEHPTYYHVQQNQRRQIQTFVNQRRGRTGIVQSLPAPNMRTILPEKIQSGSAPVDPDSPLSPELSSAATSVSEIDVHDMLSDIINVEPVDTSCDSDLSYIQPTLNDMSSTMPSNNMISMFDGGSNKKPSSSCPDFSEQPLQPFLTEDEAKIWYKDRQKKDNHNMIERRRRFNINDRIKELGTMLPKSNDPDMRQNKGTILKASVDYIRKLRKDQDRLRIIEDKQRQTETINRKMLIRIQQLELLMNAHGISANLGDEFAGMTTVLNQDTLHLPVTVAQEPELSHQALVSSLSSVSQTNSTFDLMDDSSPVSGDPMLSSAPVSPHMEEDSNDYL
ncbi:hypothetical protein ScPMuIL_008579 [Solemya velum]